MKTLRTGERFRVYRAVHKLLKEAHPGLFPGRGRRPPLKTGIMRDIVSVHGQSITATNIRIFLRIWTRSTAYLHSVSRGGARFALDMSAESEVSEGHALEAKEKIRTRKARSTR